MGCVDAGMGNQDDFVLDPVFARWVWKYIRSRARVYWPADKRLTFIVKAGPLDKQKYYRSGSWNDDNPKNWVRDRDGLAFVESPRLPFVRDKVSNVWLAGVSYTVIGSWYTFEARNAEGEPAVFDPIRLPVTDDMIEEAKEWARGYGGESLRVKGVEFQRRFATALPGDEAERAATRLNDVHVRVPDVETEREAKEIVREATDMAERAVRVVM